MVPSPETRAAVSEGLRSSSASCLGLPVAHSAVLPFLGDLFQVQHGLSNLVAAPGWGLGIPDAQG